MRRFVCLGLLTLTACQTAPPITAEQRAYATAAQQQIDTLQAAVDGLTQPDPLVAASDIRRLVLDHPTEPPVATMTMIYDGLTVAYVTCNDPAVDAIMQRRVDVVDCRTKIDAAQAVIDQWREQYP